MESTTKIAKEWSFLGYFKGRNTLNGEKTKSVARHDRPALSFDPPWGGPKLVVNAAPRSSAGRN